RREHPARPPAQTAVARLQGQPHLDKARMELRRGQTGMARHLATEVYNGPFGMQPEAAQVLRSIDVEEHNQRVLTANRSYDAGISAFRNKDYVQADAIFRQVDVGLLAADKKQQFKEVLVACQKAQDSTATAMAKASTSPAVSVPSPSGVVATSATGPATPVVPESAGGITGLQGQKPAMTPAA